MAYVLTPDVRFDVSLAYSNHDGVLKHVPDFGPSSSTE